MELGVGNVIGRLIYACLSLLVKIKGRASRKGRSTRILMFDAGLVNDHLYASDPVPLIEGNPEGRGG